MLNYRRKNISHLVALICLLASLTTPTRAQDMQGLGDTKNTTIAQFDASLSSPRNSQLIDFREELRTAIQRAARYAREVDPGFIIGVMAGSELLSKQRQDDIFKRAPARAYQRSIDAIFFEGLYVGNPVFNQSRSAKESETFRTGLEFARKARLPVFNIDFTNETDGIRRARQQAAKDRIVNFISDQPNGQQNTIPRLPARPSGENGNSILSLEHVKTFVLIRDSSGFGNEKEYAFTLKNTNYDLVLTSPFHGRKPLSRQAVETLKYKKLGARRLVFALMDIGSASAYHYYWRDDWQKGYPGFIVTPYPADPDRYFVEYWDPEWQQTMFGNTGSFLYGLITLGFDGVVIEGGDAYRFFENAEAVLAEQRQ